jgi:hypothetical protein
MNGILTITFKFMNGDSISMDGKNIGYFNAFNIMSGIERQGGLILPYRQCERFAISMFRNGNFECRPNKDVKSKKIKAFDRLLKNDLICVELSFDQSIFGYKNQAEFGIPWDAAKENDRIYNLNMGSVLNSYGDLYIIAEEKISPELENNPNEEIKPDDT